MNFTKFSPIEKKLQQERAEVKAIIRGLERIRRRPSLIAVRLKFSSGSF